MDERCSGSGSGGGGGGGDCLGYTWRVGGDVACSTHDCLVLGTFLVGARNFILGEAEISLIFLPVHIVTHIRIVFNNALYYFAIHFILSYMCTTTF